MIWNDEQLRFTAADLQVLKQAGFTPAEIPPVGTVRAGLPPLWSPLSYTLWKMDGCTSPAQIWQEHRLTMDMAHRSAFYYRQSMIAKFDGCGTRKLNIPLYQLREEQELLLTHILQPLEVSEYAFAFRRGVSMRRCAQPHCGAPVLIHLDIRNFFGSVTRAQVAAALEKATGYSEKLCDFFAALCCCGGVLPQGASTSPLLSNLVLRDVDEEIARLADQCGAVYTRYADDLYLSGDIADPMELTFRIRLVLDKAGFALNRKKCTITTRDRHMKVLGMTTNEKLQVDRRYRRQVRQDLYYFRKFGAQASGVESAGGCERYLFRLAGRIAYILQVNPDDVEMQRAKAEVAELLQALQIGDNCRGQLSLFTEN